MTIGTKTSKTSMEIISTMGGVGVPIPWSGFCGRKSAAPGPRPLGSKGHLTRRKNNHLCSTFNHQATRCTYPDHTATFKPLGISCSSGKIYGCIGSILPKKFYSCLFTFVIFPYQRFLECCHKHLRGNVFPAHRN